MRKRFHVLRLTDEQVGQVTRDWPWFPFSLGTFEKPTFFDEPHSTVLAELLEAKNPALLHRYFNHVLPAAHRTRRAEEELESLLLQRNEVAVEVGALRSELESLPEVNDDREADFLEWPQPRKPQRPWFLYLLPIGLCFMLWLGISELLGIEVTSPETNPLNFAISLAAAVAMNLGEFMSIRYLVRAYK
jgi:hypothetical protein